MLPEKIVKIIQETFKKRNSIHLSEKFIQDLLNGSDIGMALKNDLMENGGLDTDERERFQDLFSYELTGMYWPSNCDSMDYQEEFEKRLIKAIEEKEGISLF